MIIKELSTPEVNLYKEKCKTVQELIETLEGDLWQEGQILCQLALNGLPIFDGDELRMAQFRIHDVTSIRIHSEYYQNISHEVLTNWLNELPKLIAGIDHLAVMIRSDGIFSHFKELISMIESCQLLIESIMSLEKLWPPNIETVEIPLGLHLTELTHAIGQCLKAIETNDEKELANALDFDLAHSLTQILEDFKKIVVHKSSDSQ